MGVPARLADQILQSIPEAGFCNRADRITRNGGAYLLLLRLSSPLLPDLKPFPGLRLDPGWYIYCGSANGPGGLKARLARHLKLHKTLRWHVDRLSTAAAEIIAVPVSGGSECELFGALCGQPGFSTPAPGFGSSDCRQCPSHLLLWRG